MYKSKQYKRHSRVYKRKTREAHRGPGRIELQMVYWRSTLQLRHSDQQLGESTRSKLHDLDMRIQGSQMKLPRRVVGKSQVASKDERKCVYRYNRYEQV